MSQIKSLRVGVRCRRFLVFAGLLAAALQVWASDRRTDSLLRELDRIIPIREDYSAERRVKIREAMQQLSSVTGDADMYNIYRRLFSLYRCYRGDSALWVAAQRLQVAKRLGERSKITSASLNLAESYSLAGNYSDALQILDTLPREGMEPYHTRYLYNVYKNTYSRLAKNEAVESQKIMFESRVRGFRDSLLKVCPDNEAEHYEQRGLQLLSLGYWKEALELMRKREKLFGISDNASALAEMAAIYHYIGDREKEKLYLSQSALLDLKNSVKDHASLMELAKLLNEEGESERAYRYIRCALEDASFCNAKSHTGEILQAVPIIDAAYNENVLERSRILKVSVVIISFLAIALAVALWIVRIQLRSNRKNREQLDRKNAELSDINDRLTEANVIKEKYISELFDAHSDCIKHMSEFRKSILRLMKTSQFSSVLDLAKSDKVETEGRRELYAKFDEVFLSLYPRFVAEFNDMVVEEARVDPDIVTLTSELRVLALMRLGITGGGQIAKILHYTPQTVYNYKFRIRSWLIVPKEEFEARIATAGRG